MLMGPGWQSADDTVFTQPTGAMLDLPSIGRRLRTVAKAASVPAIRVHDLRHTHATHLLAAGVNPKIVSERLGHTSVAFTLDTYGHVMATQQAGAAAEALLS
jgi:integrase